MKWFRKAKVIKERECWECNRDIWVCRNGGASVCGYWRRIEKQRNIDWAVGVLERIAIALERIG